MKNSEVIVSASQLHKLQRMMRAYRLAIDTMVSPPPVPSSCVLLEASNFQNGLNKVEEELTHALHVIFMSFGDRHWMGTIFMRYRKAVTGGKKRERLFNGCITQTFEQLRKKRKYKKKKKKKT